MSAAGGVPLGKDILLSVDTSHIRHVRLIGCHFDAERMITDQ